MSVVVEIVVRDLSPAEYGDLVTLKKRGDYETWRALIVDKLLEEEEENG